MRKAYVRGWYWGVFCGWASTTAAMAVATLVYAGWRT
jgi:hypothetical protein